MSDSRSDSLAAELKRRGLFDEYFVYWLQERPTFKQRLEWLTKAGISASNGSIHNLHRSAEASQWRFAEAARARESMRQSLPANISEEIRESLLQQRFNAVMGELSHKEIMDHVYADVALRKIALEEQIEPEKARLAKRKFQVETCELFVKWSEDAKAKEILAGSGSNAEKIEALGKAMFQEDWED